MHGLSVTTVEGIGNAKTRLHAVQQRMADSHSSQCGFCTPGIVMSMYTLLRNKSLPSMDDIETYFQGNLCRCTGYRPILEGLKTFTESWASSAVSASGEKAGCGRTDCCKLGEGGSGSEEDTQLFDTQNFSPYDATQEPIFPPE